MNPVSSASGMKRSGATRPKVGCCHNTSATNPRSLGPVDG
jgi:hypothetical protein